MPGIYTIACNMRQWKRRKVMSVKYAEIFTHYKPQGKHNESTLVYIVYVAQYIFYVIHNIPLG